jgi:hypothetical protein
MPLPHERSSAPSWKDITTAPASAVNSKELFRLETENRLIQREKAISENTISFFTTEAGARDPQLAALVK